MDPLPLTDQRPTEDYVYSRPPLPALTLYEELAQLQKRSRPAFWTEEAGGYWVFTDHEAILDGLQQPDLWSSEIITPTDRDPAYRLVPVMTDPPDHAKWRHLLSEWFSPKRVRSMRAEQERRAAELVAGVRDAGQTDFLHTIGQVFPAQVFLSIMGMPMEMLDEFLSWEDEILHLNADSDPDGSRGQAAQAQVVGYLGGLVVQRRENPELRGDDLISAAVDWRPGPRPRSSEE